MPGRATELADEFYPAYKKLYQTESLTKGAQGVGKFIGFLIKKGISDKREKREREKEERDRAEREAEKKAEQERFETTETRLKAGQEQQLKIAKMPREQELEDIARVKQEHGPKVEEISTLLQQAYSPETMSNPSAQIAALMKANSLLLQIPASDRDKAAGMEPKDIQAQINQIMESTRDSETNSLKMEIAQLKAQQVPLTDVQKMRDMASQDLATARVAEINLILQSEGPEAAVKKVTEIMVDPQNTSILGTDIWRNFWGQMKDTGVVGGGEGAMGIEAQKHAEETLLKLPPGEGGVGGILVGAYPDMPDEVKERVVATDFSIVGEEWRGVPFADNEPRALFGAGTTTTKAGAKRLSDFTAQLSSEVALWRRDGWREDSRHNVTDSRVIERIAGKTSAKDELISGDTIGTTPATVEFEDPKEARLQKTVAGLRTAKITAEMIEANAEYYATRFGANGLSLDEVLEALASAGVQ